MRHILLLENVKMKRFVFWSTFIFLFSFCQFETWNGRNKLGDLYLVPSYLVPSCLVGCKCVEGEMRILYWYYFAHPLLIHFRGPPTLLYSQKVDISNTTLFLSMDYPGWGGRGRRWAGPSPCYWPGLTTLQLELTTASNVFIHCAVSNNRLKQICFNCSFVGS